MPILLAQFAAANVGHLVIGAIVFIVLIGIGLIVMRQANITIPPFAIQIFWLVVAALVGIFAIRLVMGWA